jgi:hypothetical protein
LITYDLFRVVPSKSEATEEGKAEWRWLHKLEVGLVARDTLASSGEGRNKFSTGQLRSEAGEAKVDLSLRLDYQMIVLAEQQAQF